MFDEFSRRTGSSAAQVSDEIITTGRYFSGLEKGSNRRPRVAACVARVTGGTPNFYKVFFNDTLMLSSHFALLVSRQPKGSSPLRDESDLTWPDTRPPEASPNEKGSQ